jgi:hypothetical protein
MQTRKAAELALEEAKTSEGALSALSRELCNADDEYVRHMAALILRRWIQPLWGKQAPDQKAALHQTLQNQTLKGECPVCSYLLCANRS